MTKHLMHIVTPVWGEAYVNCFIDVCIPALLAPNNAPFFAGKKNLVHHIITTPEDREVLKRAPAFQKLAEAIDIRFDETPSDPKAGGDRHHWQSYCNRVGIEYADSHGAAMIFLNADVVVADGGIKSLYAMLERGKRAVQALAVRVVKEEVVPKLIERHRSADGIRLSIMPRDLIRLTLEHLHPLVLQHLYDGPDLDLSPSALFWVVEREGLIARCFHLHPMMVYPRIKNAAFSTTIDDDYLRSACPDPADEYIVMDSDEFCACELSGIDRAGPGLPRGQVDKSVSSWAAAAAKLQHFENVARRIILRCEDGDKVAWQKAANQSDTAISAILRQVAELKAVSPGAV